ncbi:MAG TPA: histidine kinase N-terminal domain-containing protein [Acidimicrobiales bacterium]|nr:histidine kinase N-terminal domain-containing protein [Acidimicrobiales bacterium]
MATMAELARDYTDLDGPTLSHLQRLVASWGMLSDLCFADLLLFVPVAGSADQFVVLGQVRPTTSQTLHRDDLVGHVIDEVERPLVARCWRLASIVEGEVGIPSRNERGRLVSIPVRWQDKVVAVMTRESALSVGRRPGELERIYVELFDRFARMIVGGDFPYPIEEAATTELRVGDGVLVLDARGRMAYASPNAVNALHRMGMHSGLEGTRLDEAGIDQAPFDEAFATGLPVTVEVESRPDVTVVIRCMPVLENHKVTGALLLMRDVSDLKRFHRLLLSKDAAIREVHHRVKNNLQTISSLLRLQARRLAPGEGRAALEESERRVRTIALVHEILSRDASDQVDFNDIVPALVRMAEDLLTPVSHFRIGYEGDAGELPASVATPLAVILTELLQNAAEHAFGDGPLSVAGSLALVPDPWVRPSSGLGEEGQGKDLSGGTADPWLAPADGTGDGSGGGAGPVGGGPDGRPGGGHGGGPGGPEGGHLGGHLGGPGGSGGGHGGPEGGHLGGHLGGHGGPEGGHGGGPGSPEGEPELVAGPPTLPGAHEPLRVNVSLKRDDGQLVVEVRDNGRGLPPGFSIERTTSLGLSIVRDLVLTQLGGRIEMHTDGGTIVRVMVPTLPRETEPAEPGY